MSLQRTLQQMTNSWCRGEAFLNLSIIYKMSRFFEEGISDCPLSLNYSPYYLKQTRLFPFRKSVKLFFANALSRSCLVGNMCMAVREASALSVLRPELLAKSLHVPHQKRPILSMRQVL